MEDALACGHPLDVAAGDGAGVSSEVFVQEDALSVGEHVGDRLEATVRVVGETTGCLNAELVQHEEGVEVAQLVAADAAADAGAAALALLAGLDDLVRDAAAESSSVDRVGGLDLSRSLESDIDMGAG